ncbi:MAG: O-antigen ligase family protein [Kineosporiaceae bacterium]
MRTTVRESVEVSPGESPVIGRTRSGASLAVLALLLALIGALVRQGATEPAGRWLLGLGLASFAATVAATVARAGRGDGRPWTLRPRRPGGAAATTAVALALAGWMLLVGRHHGTIAAAAAPVALLTALLVIWHGVARLATTDRAALREGLELIGVVIAGLTWAGFVLRRAPWAATGRGLWRADGPLTYANATAAVLALTVALMITAGSDTAGLMPPRLRRPAGAVVLAALAATLSRGGLLALAVVVVVVAALAGRRPVASVAAMAGGGAVIELGLLPSVRADSLARPVPAVASLVLGVGLAMLLDGRTADPGHDRPGRRAHLPVAAGWLAVVGLLVAAASLLGARLTLDSSHRRDAAVAAWRAVLRSPWFGTGPSAPQVHWHNASGASVTLAHVHDEYLQVLLQYGVPAGVLLLILLVAVGRQLSAARPAPADPRRLGWAGCVAAGSAFAVHSGLDFLWHLPAVACYAVAVMALTQPPSPTGPGGVQERTVSP